MRKLVLSFCLVILGVAFASDLSAQFEINNLATPCAYKVKLRFMDNNCNLVGSAAVAVYPNTILNVAWPANATSAFVARVDSGVPGGQGFVYGPCSSGTANVQINGCNGLPTYVSMAPNGTALEIVQ